MTIRVIKIVIIFFFAFSSNIFAEMGQAIRTGSFPPLEIRHDTNKAGMIRTKINIQGLEGGKFDFEFITIIHDKKGNLIFYKHHIYKNFLLVRAIENGIVRVIIPGATDCDFKVIEPSGDTISFNLDSKEEKSPKVLLMSIEDEDIAFFKHLKAPIVPIKNKYDEIIHNRWEKKCRWSIGFQR